MTKPIFFVVLSLFILSVVANPGAVDDYDVVVLGVDNFQETIEKNEFVFVEFYAPWCGHCKSLVPEYANTASTLKNEGSPVVVAKVDATQHQTLAERFGVKGFPTLKFFRNGNPIDYDGGRTAKEIIAFIQRKSGSASTALRSQEEITAFTSGVETSKIVAFIESTDEANTKIWLDTCKSSEFEHFLCGHVTVSSLFASRNTPTAAIYKQGETKPISLTGEFTKRNIISWAVSEGFPIVEELAQLAWQRAQASKLPLLAIFFSTVDDAAKSLAREIGLKFKGQVKTTISAQNSIGERWGASGKVFPTAILVRWIDDTPKFSIFDESSETFTLETAENFISKGLLGEYKSYRKSEEIPEKNDGPVKVIVGKNFEEIVKDKTKDVFVEFYAPWCGHCKKLAPTWDELGLAFHDKESIIIGKIDGTANGIPDDIPIRGFPTLIFFSADNKAGITYEGDRSLEALKKFVISTASISLGNKDEL